MSLKTNACEVLGMLYNGIEINKYINGLTNIHKNN